MTIVNKIAFAVDRNIRKTYTAHAILTTDENETIRIHWDVEATSPYLAKKGFVDDIIFIHNPIKRISGVTLFRKRELKTKRLFINRTPREYTKKFFANKEGWDFIQKLLADEQEGA